MSRRIPRPATDAMDSMVIVGDSASSGEYCCGFVAVKRRTGEGTSPKTLLIAPHAFVRGREQRLTICFNDGVKLPAQVLAEVESFCLLETAAHSGCEAIRFIEDDSTPSKFTPCSTFMCPPYNEKRVFFQESYLSSESIESYFITDYKSLVPNSKNYFLVGCEYLGTTPEGLSKLMGAPVFRDSGTGMTKDRNLTMGVILQDCRPGNEMRVAVTSTHLKEIILKLDPPPPPRKPTKQGGDGQKGGRGGKLPFLTGGQKGGRGGKGGQKRKRTA